MSLSEKIIGDFVESFEQDVEDDDGYKVQISCDSLSVRNVRLLAKHEIFTEVGQTEIEVLLSKRDIEDLVKNHFVKAICLLSVIPALMRMRQEVVAGSLKTCPRDLADEYAVEIKDILQAMVEDTLEIRLMTDLAEVWMMLDTTHSDEEIDQCTQKMSKILGVTVDKNDKLVDIAKRLRKHRNFS